MTESKTIQVSLGIGGYLIAAVALALLAVGQCGKTPLERHTEDSCECVPGTVVKP